MPTVVVVTSHVNGRVNIATELARRLAHRGHRAFVAGVTAEARAAMASRGVPYLDAGPAYSDSDSAAARTGAVDRITRLGKSLRPALRRRTTADAVAALGLSNYLETIEGVRPDLVLMDLELAEHFVATHAVGLPVAGWTSMLSVAKRPNLPPLGSPIIPGQGAAGTPAGIETAWLRVRAERALLYARQTATRAGADRRSVLRAVAADAGYELEAHFDWWQWLKPLVPRSIPVLLFNNWELEFPHPAPEQWHYVGPLLGNRHDEPDLSDRLADLVAARDRGQIEAILYCSFGAWKKGDQLGFLSNVVAAVAGRPKWHLIVGLGGQKLAADVPDPPTNVDMLDWAPQTQILAVTDVAIHHGGISSINECLRAGVPMVVYPFEFLDQPGNAARVAAHGLGLRGDRQTSNANDVAAAIATVLQGRFRENVAAMQDLLRESDRANDAVRTVEGLIPTDRL